MTRVKILLAGVLAVVMAVVPISAAYAAPAQQTPDTQRRVVAGVVKAVDGNTITLTTRFGEDVKIAAASDTSIRAPGKAQASLSDVAAGSRVVVVAQMKDNVLTAISVTVNPVRAARQDRLERTRRVSVARSARALVRSLERELAHAPDAAKPDLQKALDAAKLAQAAAQDALKKLPAITTPQRAVIRGTVTDVNAAEGTVTVQPSAAGVARRAGHGWRGQRAPGMRGGNRWAPEMRGRGQQAPGVRERMSRLPVTLMVTDSSRLARNADQQARIADVKIGDVVVSGVYAKGTSEALRLVVMSPDFLIQLRGARRSQAPPAHGQGFGPRGGFGQRGSGSWGFNWRGFGPGSAPSAPVAPRLAPNPPM